MILIIDIDLTIADGKARFELAGPEPAKKPKRGYDKWLNKLQAPGELAKDRPVPQMRELINSLRGVESPVWIYYLTSRSKKHHLETAHWLSNNGFYPGPLWMRENDDYRVAAVYKEEATLKILEVCGAKPEENVIFIDDDPGISTVCKKHGWLHLVPHIPTPLLKKAARKRKVA